MKSLIGMDIIARSFGVGSDALTRVLQGAELPIEVTFRAALTEAVLCVETRVGHGLESTQLPMQAEGNRYRATLSCTQPGSMRFKVRYRIGDAWRWDHVPYCYLMVDPRRVGKLRMYTLLPTASGSIPDWVGQLPHIAAMGFNMVHLLPITEMGKSQSPYAARNLLAIDPRYLDSRDPRDGHAQFSSFVEALKENGLGLCVDLVLNHVAIDSEIAETHVDWLAEDAHEADGIKRAGWQGADLFHRWEDLAFLEYEPFDQQSADHMWATMLRYAMYWADFAAATDGMLRLDNLHSSHRQFIAWALQRVRDRHPHLIVLAELFTDESSTLRITRQVGVNLILATQWEHKFVPQLRGYLRYIHSTSHRVRYYFPISSHDSGAPAQEYGDVRSTAPRLVVSALLGPGPTGIVQGVEHGVLGQVRFIGPPSDVPVTPGMNLAPLIRSLFALVDAHPALRAPGNLEFFDAEHDAILAGARRDALTGRAEVLVCVNVDVRAAQTLSCDLTSVAPEGSVFREVTSGELLHSGRVSITLAPGAHCVYLHV